MLIASIFEKWKGGCAFGYGFHTHCRPQNSQIVFFCPCGLFLPKVDTFIVFDTKSPVAACFGPRWSFFQIRNKNKKKACFIEKSYLCGMEIEIRSRGGGKRLRMEQFLKDHPEAVVIKRGDGMGPRKGANIEYEDPRAVLDMISGRNPKNELDELQERIGVSYKPKRPAVYLTSNPGPNSWLESFMKDK